MLVDLLDIHNGRLHQQVIIDRDPIYGNQAPCRPIQAVHQHATSRPSSRLPLNDSDHVLNA